jgi:hypothetical protein
MQSEKLIVMLTSYGGSVSDPSSRVDGSDGLGPRDGEVTFVGGARIPTLGHDQLNGST